MFIIFFSFFSFHFFKIVYYSPVTRHPPPVTRHPPPVTRHPSPVTRHPSPVTRGKVLPFDSRSSFFAPKPHGNACYAG